MEAGEVEQQPIPASFCRVTHLESIGQPANLLATTSDAETAKIQHCQIEYHSQNLTAAEHFIQQA